jgi:hypothetical protein
MKEAFLMGLLAMGANADDNDINVSQVITPVTVNQDGKDITYHKKSYRYSITAKDTKADVGPQVTRHVVNPL